MTLRKNGNLTEGVIWKQLLLFSIPLLIGNLFQQLYNTVDSVIVGNFAGKNALAAVGTSGPLINLLVGFVIGLGSGATVLISRYFGAQDQQKLHDAIHTFACFTLVVGALMTVMGVLLSPTILNWMKTPADVFDGATTYLRVYFLGTLAMLIYNSGSAILRALGNSKMPLYFLMVSSVVNIILDYIFVAVFHWDVAGVAWATLIANAVSSILVIYVLLYKTSACPLEVRKIRIDKVILTDMLKIGIPAGLQTFIVSISNTMVMSHVNSFGASAISGFTSANKFDNFLGLPLQSFSIAITTFVGQNLGAQKPERIKKGILWSVGLSLICIIVLGTPAYLLAEHCIRIFIDDADVIRIGAQMMRTVIPFYVFLIFHQVLSGAVRGAGYTTMPMISAIFSFTFLRQIFLNTFMPSVQDVSLVFWSYALTWGVSGIIMLCYTLFGPWKKCLKIQN